MISSRPIRNIGSDPPYFMGIRGKYFMQAVLACSAVAMVGILSLMALWFLDEFWTGALLLLPCAGTSFLIYRLYRSKSKVVPFRELRGEGDLIAHVKLKKWTR